MNTTTAKKTDPDIFHNHLDICKQCRENPFGLCVIGSNALLRATGNENNPLHAQRVAPNIFDMCADSPEEAAMFNHVVNEVKGPVGDLFRMLARG
jgi:hypothetical protein